VVFVVDFSDGKTMNHESIYRVGHQHMMEANETERIISADVNDNMRYRHRHQHDRRAGHPAPPLPGQEGILEDFDGEEFFGEDGNAGPEEDLEEEGQGREERALVSEDEEERGVGTSAGGGGDRRQEGEEEEVVHYGPQLGRPGDPIRPTGYRSIVRSNLSRYCCLKWGVPGMFLCCTCANLQHLFLILPILLLLSFPFVRQYLHLPLC
jgi:hypothetical protein